MPPPKIPELALPAEAVQLRKDHLQVVVKDTDLLGYTQSTYWLLALSIMTDEHVSKPLVQKQTQQTDETCA
jgi:hypothetical protein